MTIEEMKELYSKGFSTNEIAKLAGFKTGKSISDKLKASGFMLRTSHEAKQLKKTYSEDIFEKLVHPWQAYYLGLLLTDGWITGERTIGYSSVDKDVVEYISCFTGKSVQTILREGRVIGPQGKEINRQIEYRVALSSKKMIKDLERLGIVHRKTKILEGPNLLVEELPFLKYILRGIIDGDGTLGFPSNYESTMYFRIVSASKDFILWCKWALEVLGMTELKTRSISKDYFELYSAKPANLAILALSIYKGTMGMERKANKVKHHFFTHTIGRLSEKSE
jgi:hypothetical protein